MMPMIDLNLICLEQSFLFYSLYSTSFTPKEQILGEGLCTCRSLGLEPSSASHLLESFLLSLRSQLKHHFFCGASPPLPLESSPPFPSTTNSLSGGHEDNQQWPRSLTFLPTWNSVT